MISRRPFTQKEDSLILKGIQLYGKGYWKQIAELVTNRTEHQVRERYRNYLNPNINKYPWTPEEDAKLTMLVSQHGNKWSMFSKSFHGRTPTAIKNRWNVHLSRDIKSSSKTEIHENIFFNCLDFNLEDDLYFLE
jgi:hypothetical protein